MEGTPMVDNELDVVGGQLRSWSGMRLGSSRWLVLTPGGAHRTSQSNVTVEVALGEGEGDASDYTACDCFVC
jgi:hypothetical protein